MSGHLLHVGAMISCPHAGQVSVITTNTRVLVSSQPVATANDQFPVAGCGQSNPCVEVKWVVPAARVKVSGQPVVLDTSTGACVPTGVPTVLASQMRVKGT